MTHPIRLLGAGAALAAAPALAQNLIQNGSFESPALSAGRVRGGRPALSAPCPE